MGGPNSIVVVVWMLQPGEDLIVAKRLREVLTKAVKAQSRSMPEAFHFAARWL
jgi:hypothetical protein